MTPLFILIGLLTAFALAALLMPAARHTVLPRRQRMAFVILTALAFTAASLGIYGWIGSPRIVPMLAERDQRIARIASEISDNLEKVRTNPDDLGAWVVLGAAFLETGQLDSAVGAFRQAVLISGGDPALILAYAKAQIMQADGAVTDSARRGLEMVLMLSPDNPDARYFMAVRQLQDGNAQEAMKEMKALYRSLPEDSPLKAMIDQQTGKY